MPLANPASDSAIIPTMHPSHNDTLPLPFLPPSGIRLLAVRRHALEQGNHIQSVERPQMRRVYTRRPARQQADDGN
jgi:hypothetical protein